MTVPANVKKRFWSPGAENHLTAERPKSSKFVAVAPARPKTASQTIVS